MDEKEPKIPSAILSAADAALANKQLSEAALRLSRKQRLEAMVYKRKYNFSYLQKAHFGDTYWLNTTLLTKEYIQQYSKQVPEKRTSAYFYLGLSLGAILESIENIGFIDNSYLQPDSLIGPKLIRVFSQLMEEFEYYCSSSAMQSMKYVMAKSAPSPYFPITALENDNESARSSLYKFNGEVAYEYFKTPIVPFELCYLDVVHTLLDLIGQLYDLFLKGDCYRYRL
jgi:hypothetical protein